MDWTKAKTILIAALIFTNIVLLGVVITNKVAVDRTIEVTMETAEILKKKNVILEVDLSFKKEKLPMLAVEYSSYDKEAVADVIASQQAEPGEPDDSDTAIRVAEAFIEECGFMDKHVKLADCSKEDGRYIVTFKNTIKGKDIERSYMVCEVKKGVVTGFTRDWLTPIEFGRSKKEIVPVTTALMKFLSEKTDNAQTVINDISVVYYLDPSYVNPENTESDTAFPAWRIQYDGGKVKFILAYDTN